ncbi:MAG: radical SAM protein [Treponema sp.]|nr:radical SAM protein [Treponema sp.]
MTAPAEIYIHSTLAYCTHCGTAEFARIMARESGVYLERVCPAKGTSSIKIAADPAWYRKRTLQPRSLTATPGGNPVRKGCPYDCGLCQWHSGKLHLPVFSITNDCNLDCPICFTFNRPDQKYYKSAEDTKKNIGHILHCSGSVQLINLTGGEPTLHPQLFELLEACRQEGIGRITMNTNGLRLASDVHFTEQLKAAGVQVVLSLDTLDAGKSRLIHGRDITQAKQKCLEHLEALDIPTTILPVCIKGCNEDDVAAIVHTYLHKPFVRSITIQNMTYTGKNGQTFHPREHITLDEVEALLSGQGDISQDDFFAPASYHPLCYSAAYYIVRDGELIPLNRVLGSEAMAEMSKDAYVLNPCRDFSAEFREGINKLWAEGMSERKLAILRAFLHAVYPDGGFLPEKERQEVLEQWIKMILIHPHMDADNFDIARVSSCGDLVPDEQGQMIPACSYNLLYRQNDPRFWAEGPVQKGGEG